MNSLNVNQSSITNKIHHILKSNVQLFIGFLCQNNIFSRQYVIKWLFDHMLLFLLYLFGYLLLFYSIFIYIVSPPDMQDYNECANIIQQQKNVTNHNSNNLIHQFDYIYKSQNNPYAHQHNKHQQSISQELNSQNKLDDNQSDQDAKNQKKQKKIRKESYGRNVNKGHWTQQENKKYHLFLEIHYRHFVNRHMRRMDKIFKTMQLFIGTRQAEQCRSHHQKMQKKYHIFTNIIQNLRKGHYETLSIEPILDELKRQNIQFKDCIKTMQQLLLMQQNNKDLFIKIQKRQKKQAKTPLTQLKMAYSDQLIQKDSIGILIQGHEAQKEQQVIEESHDKIDMLEQSNNVASGFLDVVKQENSSLLFYNMFE